MALFYVDIKIKQHPYIKKMRIQLNNGAIQIPTVGERKDAEYNSPDYSYGFPVDKTKNWKKIEEYQHYLSMAEEIKSVLEN